MVSLPGPSEGSEAEALWEASTAVVISLSSLPSSAGHPSQVSSLPQLKVTPVLAPLTIPLTTCSPTNLLPLTEPRLCQPPGRLTD